jgi:hypothetical protein
LEPPKGFAKWVFLGLSLVLVFIWEQVQSTRLGYRVEQTRGAMQTQENLNAYLRTELQKFKSPARLMEQAKRRLKMDPPAPSSIVLLTDPVQTKPTGFLARIFGRAS